jgi:4-amino-4-deoxy-L-arabinose transferase-like glycosyltransferase
MMNSAENNKGEAGLIRFLASMPLSCKLFLLVIIALIPRIIVFLQPQIITIDGTLYIKMAKLFSEGQYDGIPRAYFSLYPLLIFLVQKFVEDWELSGQLISITLGTLSVIPVFLLGRSLYDEKIGWLSAIFYVTLPNFLKFDSQVIRDPTLWFFILLTVWLVWEGNKKDQTIFFGFASMSAGLGAITRVEGFILWVALSFYLVFRKVPGISMKRRTLYLTLFILIFPILLSPVLLSLKKNSSQVAFNEMRSFAVTFIRAHAGWILNPEDPIAIMGQKAYDSLPQRSQDSLELAGRHRIVLAISEVIHKFAKSANLLFILILIGVWKRRKEGFGSSDRYLLYVFAALFCMSVFYCRQIYYFSTRHGLTLVLPVLFLAGHGLGFLVETLSNGLHRMASRWISIKTYLGYTLTVFLLALFLAQALSGKGTEKVIIKEAGIWLKQKGYQGSLIMAPKNFLRVAFYADGTFLEMPGSWEKTVETMRQRKVQVVMTDPSTIEQDCPGFLGNWERAGLAPLHRIKGKRLSEEIEIYLVP